MPRCIYANAAIDTTGRRLQFLLENNYLHNGCRSINPVLICRRHLGNTLWINEDVLVKRHPGQLRLNTKSDKLKTVAAAV